MLTCNCRQGDDTTGITNLKRIEKPTIVNEIDSVKFKSEIFRLDTLFEKLYRANAFNGNVLIAKGKSIVYKKSFGLSVKETNRLLNDSSLFQLASISKVITSAGVLVLYEQQKLNLDDKVSDILVGFPYKNVTVKHLLSHRSGLPNYSYFCSQYPESNKIVLSNKDVLEMMIKYKPLPYFNEGCRFNYSNTNYALLALIIEKISGKSFANFLTDELFTPLGLKHTSVYEKIDPTNVLLTQGYTTSFKKVAQDKFDGINGDKGIYTTTHDFIFIKFCAISKLLVISKNSAISLSATQPRKKMQ